ncbi:MAG: EAL domain-containing protein [Pseudomonadota bacterium]
MALIFPALTDGDDRLDALANGLGGSAHRDLALVCVSLGSNQAVPSVDALAERLFTDHPELTDTALACWVDDATPLAVQLPQLAKAQPFTEWLSSAASPLLEILEAGRLETWFQPVFARDKLDLWGYECLVRARTSDGNLVAPDTLFSWAREDQLLFMLDRVCRETHIGNAAQANHRPDLNFLINFLPTVIYQPEVCLETTFAAARKAQINPRQIIFEVVESEQVNDTEFLRSILETYRAAGFRVALDDIGAGAAGLDLLAELTPDILKIDRSLVRRSSESEAHAAVCRTLVALGHELDRAVIAEGIETEAQYEHFHNLGVDLFQGFLFGRPSVTPPTVADVRALPVP